MNPFQGVNLTSISISEKSMPGGNTRTISNLIRNSVGEVHIRVVEYFEGFARSALKRHKECTRTLF
jgi:hypothetical protein